MSRMGMKKAAAAVVAGAALFAAGCGGGDGGSPEGAVEALYSAAVDGDAGAVCDNLSTAAIEASVEEGSECEDALDSATLEAAGAFLGEFEVGEADVDGGEGTVEVSFAGETSDVPVVEEDGEWKVDEGL
jgi:hypothetical protein